MSTTDVIVLLFLVIQSVLGYYTSSGGSWNNHALGLNSPSSHSNGLHHAHQSVSPQIPQNFHGSFLTGNHQQSVVAGNLGVSQGGQQFSSTGNLNVFRPQVTVPSPLAGGSLLGNAPSLPSLTGATTGSNTLLTPEIMKHIYISVIPDDPPSPPIRPVFSERRPVKHYKIVFIKTPSRAPQQFDDISIPEPPSEKTLIYVLSENPEPIKPVAFKDQVRRPEVPPEVFIVKYDRARNSGSQETLQSPSNGFVSPNSNGQQIGFTESLGSTVGQGNNAVQHTLHTPVNSFGDVGGQGPSTGSIGISSTQNYSY